MPGRLELRLAALVGLVGGEQADHDERQAGEIPQRCAAARSPLVRSTRIADAATTQISAPGMRIFQPKRMNWS